MAEQEQTDEQLFNTYLTGLIQNVVAQQAQQNGNVQNGVPNLGQPVPVQAQAPAPISVNIRGQQVTFNTPEEIQAAFETTLNKADELLAQAKQAPAPQQGQYISNDGVSAFDMKAFTDKIVEDAPSAIEMAFKAKTGISFDDLKRQHEEHIEQRRALVTLQFRDAHPEFVGNQQNAAAIYQAMQGLGHNPQDPRVFTTANLEAAYAIARMNGRIQINEDALPQQQAQPVQQAQQPAYNLGQPVPGTYQQYQQQYVSQQRPLAPPSVPRTSSDVMPDPAALAENMSIEQLQQVLSQIAAQR